jgi:peptidoglycan/LPS O-acetylase OafA/YrhL
LPKEKKSDIKVMQRWNSRYHTLDHWRGIAALWVVLFHGFGTTYDKTLHPLAEALKAIAAPGWLGVHLFFVISGYCIMASLYNLSLKQESAWAFLKSRFWRLYPTYWLAFLLALILNLASSPFNKVDLNTLLPNSWQAWLGNIFLIQPYIDVPYYVVVYWSLVIEVGFYLIAASLFILWNNVGKNIAAFVGLTLGIISIFLAGSQIALLSPIAAWGEFLCGVLVFTALFARSQNRAYLHSTSLTLLFVLGMISIGANIQGQESWLWFSALFALGLYLLYKLDQKIVSVNGLRWLQSIGFMSYSLYLLHVPLQGRIINLSSRFIFVESLLMIPLQILGWTVAIAGSYLFYRIAEKPLNEWRQHQNKLIK